MDDKQLDKYSEYAHITLNKYNEFLRIAKIFEEGQVFYYANYEQIRVINPEKATQEIIDQTKERWEELQAAQEKILKLEKELKDQRHKSRKWYEFWR